MRPESSETVTDTVVTVETVDPGSPGSTLPPGDRETPAERDSPGFRDWTIGLAAGIVVVMAAVFAVAIMLASRDSTPSTTADGDGVDVTYYVPARTGERIDAGEEVEIIPDQITIRVADTLVLVNDDDRTHNLGGYNVRGGDTLRINYPRPGLYMNSCSVNPGGLVYVNVVA